MNAQSINVVMAGRAGSGKTSLINQFMEGRYKLGYISDIGSQFHTKDIQTAKGNVRLVLWDWAGPESHFITTVTRGFMGGAAGIILTYDTSTDGEASVEQAEELFEVLLELNQLRGIAFVGCKSDLGVCPEVEIQAKHLFSRIQSEFKGESFRMITSAKDNVNVDSFFDELVQLLTH